MFTSGRGRLMQNENEKKPWAVDPAEVRKLGKRSAPNHNEIRKAELFVEEHERVRALRISVIDAWNLLEDGVAAVLRVAACMPDPVAASILYFSPTSFSTRLQMVDRLVEHLVIEGAKDPALLAEWKRISAKLKTPKNVRDLAAHGLVVSIHQDGRNHVRLTPSPGQFHTHLKSHRDGKLPGKGRLDLEQAFEAIETRITLLEQFSAKLRLA